MITRYRQKRIIDVAICISLLPVAFPVSALAMAIICVESSGSPLFVQKRVGKGKKTFRVFKLRTMVSHAGDMPSHEIQAVKITRVGAFLRRAKIDELPQLLNVLVGDMSLVGPRPCLPSQEEVIAQRDKYCLYDFLPGITGPAQLAGVDMSDPVLLAEVEVGYYEHATPWQDLMLILRTALGGGKGDAAARLR